jgi:cytochrome b561
MTLQSTKQQWGFVTRTLHWLIAVLVFGMIAAGLYAGSVDINTPAGEMRYFAVIDVHKSFGILLVVLILFRVVWRLSETTPALSADVPLWEVVLARVSQLLIYLGLIVIPVSGFLWATAYGEPIRFFGSKLPTIIHVKGGQATLAHHFHITAAFILLGIVGLHVAGALKNHFVGRNEVLRNMLGVKRALPRGSSLSDRAA